MCRGAQCVLCVVWCVHVYCVCVCVCVRAVIVFATAHDYIVPNPLESITYPYTLFLLRRTSGMCRTGCTAVPETLFIIRAGFLTHLIVSIGMFWRTLHKGKCSDAKNIASLRNLTCVECRSELHVTARTRGSGT
jgi:hypothetical protein